LSARTSASSASTTAASAPARESRFGRAAANAASAARSASLEALGSARRQAAALIRTPTSNAGFGQVRFIYQSSAGVPPSCS
jgi:hypothetical protein